MSRTGLDLRTVEDLDYQSFRAAVLAVVKRVTAWDDQRADAAVGDVHSPYYGDGLTVDEVAQGILGMS